ncbi:MAG: hypothetical protein S4CHLAM45_11080 [Chlamydiales bacterium]|nr:hypothetical protein [Chlamydiales bacterium]MCH9619600.1 hypothetical protein [Chlamydiales bacterium]MCH9623206.1 hypothetical protein [Chlamydiales bacterium]
MIDSDGIYGFVLHYALLFAFFGGAVLTFIYLLCKKRLDISEDPKYQVFDDE